MAHPLTVTCPRCSAAPGKYCRTPLGHLLKPVGDMNASHRERRKAVGDLNTGRKRVDDDSTVYVTKTGKVLTNADIEALAAEAERGYDISHLLGKPRLHKKMTYKVRAHEYVWCDSHGAVHPSQRDYYEESSVECRPDNWRRVYIESNDRTETF